MTDPWGSTNKHWIWCTRCDKGGTASERGVAFENDAEYGPPSRFVLTCCDGCGQVQLSIQEDFGFGYDADELARLWPSPTRPLSTEVPEKLRAEHGEARKCFDAKAYTATVVMVRRTLEGVCADRGVKEKTLVRSLEKMQEAGQLDQRLIAWAQALRILGNEGAHYTGKQVTREDAADSLAFAEAMLDYMYVLSAKFKEFSDRRNKTTADKQTHSWPATPPTAPQNVVEATFAEEPPF